MADPPLLAHATSGFEFDTHVDVLGRCCNGCLTRGRETADSSMWAVRGRSSVGRATRSQCVGQGFESPRLHSHEPRRDRRRAHLPASGITPNAIGPGRRAPESGLAGERCSGLTVNDQSIAFDLLLIRWPTRWTIKRARVFPPVENRCHMRAEAVERFVIGAAVRRRWRQKAIG